jgi:phage baseplate assembly protein W
MSSPASLYEKITLRTAQNTDQNVTRMYKGFSTLSPDSENFALYDFQLIKQDILNHFYTRQGERLMQPLFGTLIWDLLFEPLTEQLKNLMLQNVQEILNYDPRVRAEQVIITPYESGIQLECKLTYVPYNLSQTLQLRFDQANGLLTK